MLIVLRMRRDLDGFLSLQRGLMSMISRPLKIFCLTSDVRLYHVWTLDNYSIIPVQDDG